MIDALIEKYGSESQRERHAAGRLPEGELRQLACWVLFRSLEDLPRYRRLELEDIKHKPPCNGTGFVGEPIAQFKVEEDYQGSMNENQWDALTKIREALKSFPPLDFQPYIGVVAHKIRKHLGECFGCSARRHRLSVLVTAQFYGLTLSREYAL